MDGRSDRLSRPLMPFRAGFAGELARLGYTSDSARQQLVLFGSLSRWLATTGRMPGDLDEMAMEEFLAERRRAGYAQFHTHKALAPLLVWLRDAGVVPVGVAPEAEPVTEVDVLLDRYRHYFGVGAGHDRGDDARLCRSGAAVAGGPVRSWGCGSVGVDRGRY